MNKRTTTILFALLFTLAVLVLGHVMLGLLPMFLFASGFLGGFILWMVMPAAPPFARIRAPFFIALAFFVLHKVEERRMDFFPRLAEITGVPVPDTGSILVYLLYAFASTWLLIPFLMKRGMAFGHYLAWTFFTSMGITELAHFVLPFFSNEPYGYFPGMASVVLLAPTAWWGMWRLSRRVAPPKEFNVDLVVVHRQQDP